MLRFFDLLGCARFERVARQSVVGVVVAHVGELARNVHRGVVDEGLDFTGSWGLVCNKVFEDVHHCRVARFQPRGDFRANHLEERAAQAAHQVPLRPVLRIVHEGPASRLEALHPEKRLDLDVRKLVRELLHPQRGLSRVLAKRHRLATVVELVELSTRGPHVDLVVEHFSEGRLAKIQLLVAHACHRGHRAAHGFEQAVEAVGVVENALLRLVEEQPLGILQRKLNFHLTVKHLRRPRRVGAYRRIKDTISVACWGVHCS